MTISSKFKTLLFLVSAISFSACDGENDASKSQRMYKVQVSREKCDNLKVIMDEFGECAKNSWKYHSGICNKLFSLNPYFKGEMYRPEAMGKYYLGCTINHDNKAMSPVDYAESVIQHQGMAEVFRDAIEKYKENTNNLS